MTLYYQNHTMPEYVKPKPVSIAEIEELFKKLGKPFIWSNEIRSGSGETWECMSSENTPDMLIKFENPEIGHNVYAHCFIKKGTPLCDYTGNIQTIDADEQFEYRTEGHLYLKNDAKMLVGIDAKNCGNVSRFFSCLPDSIKQVRETHEVDSKIAAEIACENLMTKSVNVKNAKGRMLSVPRLIAKRDIRSGELLGYDYGDTYISYMNVAFFKRNGTMISRHLLKPKKFLIKCVTNDMKETSHLSCQWKRLAFRHEITEWINVASVKVFLDQHTGEVVILSTDRLKTLMDANNSILEYGRPLLKFASKDSLINLQKTMPHVLQRAEILELEDAFWVMHDLNRPGAAVKKSMMQQWLKKYGYYPIVFGGQFFVHLEEELKPMIDRGYDDLALIKPSLTFSDEPSYQKFEQEAANKKKNAKKEETKENTVSFASISSPSVECSSLVPSLRFTEPKIADSALQEEAERVLYSISGSSSAECSTSVSPLRFTEPKAADIPALLAAVDEVLYCIRNGFTLK